MQLARCINTVSVDEALAMCPIELYEDARGVVGLWAVLRHRTPNEPDIMDVTAVVRLNSSALTAYRFKLKKPCAFAPLMKSKIAEFIAKNDEPPHEGDYDLKLASNLEALGILNNRSNEPRLSGYSITTINYLMHAAGLDRTTAATWVRAHIGEKVSRFAKTLDPEAIAFAERYAVAEEPLLFSSNWIGSQEWAGLDATVCPGAPLRKAIERFPQHLDLLVPLWRRNRSAFTGDLYDTLTSALKRPAAVWQDAGRMRSVAPTIALAKHLGQWREVIVAEGWRTEAKDALSKLLRYDLHGLTLRTPSYAALALSCLPIDWAPSDAGEWASYFDVDRALRTVLWSWRYASAADLVNRRGDWTALRDRLFRIANCTDADGLQHAVNDVTDMTNEFRNQILAPAMALASHQHLACEYVGALDQPNPPRGWKNYATISQDGVRPWSRSHLEPQLLFGNRCLAHILEDSQCWHGRQHGITEAIEAISPHILPDGHWKAGLPNWSFGNIEIVSLTSRKALKAEGSRHNDEDGVAGLSHCVGDYGPACQAGRSRVVSLRRRTPDGGFVRLSTAEIRIRRNRETRNELILAQHRSYDNQAPTTECTDAFGAYLAACASGDLAVNWQDLAEVRDEKSVFHLAGYEYWRPGAFEAAMTAWAPCLPRRLRSWTPEQFATALCAD